MQNSEITVREAAKTDLDGILALYSQLYDKAITPDENIIFSWEKLMSYDNIHMIAAEQNGVLISTCCCTIIPSITHNARPFALVEYVVTDKSHRRTGAGKACLDYAKQLAIKQNCYKIMLITGREAAHAFYKSCGYKSDGKTAFVQVL